MTAPIQLKTAEQIRDDILNGIAVNTGITDKELGAVVRELAYATGTEVDELYVQLWKATRNAYIKTATGAGLKARGADYGVLPRGEVFAVGTQRFLGTNGTNITAGTIVSAPATSARDKIQFTTPSTGTYTIAGGFVDVPITALVSGEGSNLSSSTITQLDTSVSGVSSTTNTTATLQGRSEEGDDEYRERILAHIDGLSLGTVAAVRNGAINFEIQTVTLAEDADASQLYIDVTEDLDLVPISIVGTNYLSILSGGSISEVVSYTGIVTTSYPHRITLAARGQKSTSATTHSEGASVEEYIPTGRGRSVKAASIVETLGNLDVYLDDGTVSGISAELVSLVEKRLVGDNTDRDPGYRAGGVTLSAYAVTPVTIDVTASIQTKSGYNHTDTTSGVASDLEAYFNGFDVGATVYGYEVVERVMAYDGVQTIVSITIDGNIFNGTSSADVSILASQVARAGTMSIS